MQFILCGGQINSDSIQNWNDFSANHSLAHFYFIYFSFWSKVPLVGSVQLSRQWKMSSTKPTNFIYLSQQPIQKAAFIPLVVIGWTLCFSQHISNSFISSYGVIIFITCLQSLRLTPPLQATDTWEGNKYVTTLRVQTIKFFVGIPGSLP